MDNKELLQQFDWKQAENEANEDIRTGKIQAFDSIEDLLAGIGIENLHHEIDTGTPVGKEVW